MAVSEDVRRVRIGKEFHICPNCGYEKGFHVSFRNMNAFPDRPIKTTREMFSVILICPNCGTRYDTGWKIPFGE